MSSPFTPRQAAFLAFIHDYTKLHGRPPAEADMQRHFGTTPPSVHQMIITLEKKRLIAREPGVARSIRLLVDIEALGKKATTPNRQAKPDSILGRWRITQMDEWDQDFVDEEVEGYVLLDRSGGGEFQFGCVRGLIDHELTQRDGLPAAEWSWEGNDEMDEANGRGWAVLLEDGTIKGKIFLHGGDYSGFSAVRMDKSPARKTK